MAKFLHTYDSTAGSRKIPFIKPVCRSTVPVDQTLFSKISVNITKIL